MPALCHIPILAYLAYLIYRHQPARLCVAIAVYALLLPQMAFTRDYEWSQYLRFGALCASAVIYTGRFLRARIEANPIALTFGAAILWFFISAAASSEPREAAFRAASFAVLLVAAVGLSSAKGYSDFLGVLKVISALVLLASLALAIGGYQYAFHLTGRLQGMLGNPNDLGTLAWISCSIWLVPRERTSLRRHRQVLILLVGALVLVLTGSRASVASILLIVCFHTYISRHNQVVVALLIVGGLALTLGYGSQIAELLRLNDSTDTAQITSGRNIEHARALEYILQSPLTGVGLGACVPSGVSRGARVINQLGYHLLLVETGLPGFALLVTAFVASLYRGAKHASAGPRCPTEILIATYLVIGYLVNSTAESYLASAMIYASAVAWASAIYLARARRSTSTNESLNYYTLIQSRRLHRANR